MVAERLITVEQNATNSVPQFKPDFVYWIRHYWGLLWRWKWYILPTFPALVVTWFLLVITFGKVRPDLTANVLLGLENQSSVLVLPEAIPNGLGKMKLIHSRNFLSEIVDSLSLNCIFPRYNRSDILNYISVDSTAILGRYRFSIDETSKFSYTVYLTNNKLGVRKKAVTTGKLPSLDTLRTTGITFVFNPLFLKKPVSFDFYVLPKLDAIESLKKRIVITGNTKRDPMQEGIVILSHNGNDPQLISSTLNTIADKFVERNLSFRKRKTSDVMKALNTQLQAASSQLLFDENRIRAFKEENPNVGLGIEAQNAVSNITMLETKNMNIITEIDEAKELINRFEVSAESDDADQITSEALLFLSSRKIPGAIILQQDFNNQLQQKMSLKANRYSPDHPMVKEVQSKIEALKAKTLPLIRDFIKKLEAEMALARNQKSTTMNQLQRLPQKEMQLAALTRQQEINSEIYTNILSRYNQAKIADETEVADIYIMDYSVPPEDASARKELMKLLAIGLLVCLLIAFGPAVAFDFLDRRARSEEDLKRFMAYPILETIPVINSPKEKRKRKSNVNTTASVDPKLLAMGPFVTYVHEIFRSLRAKLNFRLDGKEARSILVTSLDSGEGKSLISSNLAIMMAQQHIPTLLIDADMRRGKLHASFAQEQYPGLSDLLMNQNQLTEEIVQYSIRLTTYPNLYLLTSGTPLENPTELLTRPRFKTLLKWAQMKFSAVIVDSPPLSPVTDPIIINEQVCGSILVVRVGKTNTSALNKVVNEYPNFKQKILGLVLNGIDNVSRNKKYNAYYYRCTKEPQQLLLTSDVKNSADV